MIQRYSELNTKFPAEGLRIQLKQYMDKKQPQGYPLLLVYEGVSANIHAMNPHVPSELAYEGTLPSDLLKVVLVPERFMADAQNTLTHHGINAQVMPIEACELL